MSSAMIPSTESDLLHTSGPRKLDHPKFKEEEENLRTRFTEQVKKEEARFRQWEQKLISERDRLNTLPGNILERTHDIDFGVK